MGEVSTSMHVSTGTPLRSIHLVIDREDVNRFLDAIGEDSPVYHDLETAIKAGFADLPVPPTYHSAILFHAYEGLFPELERLGIDTRRILHVREEYDYHRPLYAGLSLELTGKIIDVKGDRRVMIQFETYLHDGEGSLYTTGRSTILLRSMEKPGAGP